VIRTDKLAVSVYALHGDTCSLAPHCKTLGRKVAMQTAMQWIRSDSPIPTIPSLRMIRAYRFFFEHAGYIVGRRAECALSLAKAEQWANDQGLEFVTKPDCDADLSFADTWPARERDEFKRQDHEVICARLIRPCEDHGTECLHAETLASLGGIVDADNNYLRVIRAELASEAQGCN
jgi:hypothetical protein